MGARSRVLVVVVLGLAAAALVAQSGLAIAAHVGAAALRARAAAHPTVVDDTARAEADPAWPAPSGGSIPIPAAEPDATGPDGGGAMPRSASVAPAGGGRSGSMPAVTPDPVDGPADLLGTWSLPPDERAALGLVASPGCSGSGCGMPGCGFLTPGCAWLDGGACGLLEPACGLGFPISLGRFDLFGCGPDDRWDLLRFDRHVDRLRLHLDHRFWSWHRH